MSESPRSDDGYQSHYNESYAYQEPKGTDDYGQTTYTAYEPRYAYQNATGRINGIPIFNNWFSVKIFIPLIYTKKKFWLILNYLIFI